MIERNVYLEKAIESLAGAESEFGIGRYNNAANRCYYACFQAAVYALDKAGIRPRTATGEWSHAAVPAQFDGQLINRRKRYLVELRGTLARTYVLRQTADYEEDTVAQGEVARALRRTRRFVQLVQAREREIR